MNTDERLLNLVVRWEELRDAGLDITPEELCRDCPELLEALVQRLRSLQSMNVLLQRDFDKPAGPAVRPARGNTTPQLVTTPTQDSPGEEQPVLPGYELLGELGRGGMGVVYRARQTGLNRLVAVKMILGGSHAGASDMTRFRGEIEVIAALQHPNLVQIYEVGERSGQPYYSMEFVDGSNLDAQIGGRPQPPREAAKLLETLARTLEVVHRQGIIHRDLKPANILLTREGIPKVTDFGLAKRMASGAGPTVTGQVVGTPCYMAPEQAAGRTREIGPAVDVYALGVILYEMLTGKPPFEAETPWETMRQVVTEEPIPPRRWQPKVPRDLETICLKCLEKEPWRRYPRAGDLADDLRRFLDGWPPIQARPVGVLERGWKWVRRQPTVAALLLICVLALLALPVGFVVSRAQRAEDHRQQLVRLQVIEGVNALDSGDWFTALLWFTEALARDQENPERETMHRLRIGTLLHQCPRLQQYWFHKGPVNCVRFSPDGRRIITASNDGTAQVWDVVTGQAVGSPLNHQSAVKDASFSPEGNSVVTAGQNGVALVWSLETGQPSAPSLQHGGIVYCASFSADGKRILTGSEDAAARIWDVASGRLLTPLLLHRGPVRAAVFSRDGSRVVTASDDHTARVWDGHTGHPVGPPLLHEGRVTCVDCSHDGRRVVTGSQDQDGRVWDSQTGEQLARPLRHRGTLNAVSFSPTARRVLTGSADDSAALWLSVGGERLGRSMLHRSDVKAAVFSPDGRWVVTGSDDNTARVWEANSSDPVTPLLQHCATVQCASFSPEGRLVVTGTTGGTARLWALNAVPHVAVLAEQAPDALPEKRGQWWSTDRRWLVTIEPNNRAQVRRGDTGKAVGTALTHAGTILSAAFNADGTRLVTTSDDNTALIWDPATGSRLIQIARHPGSVRAAAFSPDSRLLVTLCIDGTARVWDTRTGDPLTPPLRCGGHAVRVFFDPDGTRVNVVASDRVLWSWDLRYETRSVIQLRLLARVLAGSLIDAGSQLQPLGPDALRQDWLLLQ
jgi:WD40 repeat protein/predicted Ser/Thr protein kinase